MSEIMRGVLRMPPELWTDSPLDVRQRHSVYVEAADKIERLQSENKALLTALIGVVRVCGRNTTEFDAAHAAIDLAKGRR